MSDSISFNSGNYSIFDPEDQSVDKNEVDLIDEKDIEKQESR